MEEEFEEIDRAGNWTTIFNEIKDQSCAYPYKVAKRQENRLRNRYRDVSPYDHSRVRLEHGVNDYINASLMHVEAAERRYILTQGPLPSTCGHFWQMAWEQRSRAVVMLNRLVEKGSVKCAQYWPSRGEREVSFPDVALRLTLLGEQVKMDYTIRQLQLHNITTGESRLALHFHYTTWPDFGVPESPASFLNFLQEVRSSGALGPGHGPSLVHCSAGIGRSGTFCLVDTCLLLMAGAGGGRGGPTPVDVRAVLLEMRRCRMGLIQTPDQLRFSYLAIIEGAKTVMAAPGGAEVEERWMELSNVDGDDGGGGGGGRWLADSHQLSPELPPPPPPRPERRPGPDLTTSTASTTANSTSCSVNSSPSPPPSPPSPPAPALRFRRVAGTTAVPASVLPGCPAEEEAAAAAAVNFDDEEGKGEEVAGWQNSSPAPRAGPDRRAQRESRRAAMAERLEAMRHRQRLAERAASPGGSPASTAWWRRRLRWWRPVVAGAFLLGALSLGLYVGCRAYT